MKYRIRAIPAPRLALLAALIFASSGCGGQEVTDAALKQARERWKEAGIRDYELEWTVTGAQTNHYHVTVEHGEVRSLESVRPDGERFALKPAETRFYSVDGLFLTIADELSQCKLERPFGQPQGTNVAMRFKTDTKLGYPIWYRRDVMGTSLAIAIDVVALVPAPPGKQSKDSRER
jgi:hypothetical protein